MQERDAEPGTTVCRDDADLGDPADRRRVATELAQTEADHLAADKNEQPDSGSNGNAEPILASRRSAQNSASLSTCRPQCPANASLQAA